MVAERSSSKPSAARRHRKRQVPDVPRGAGGWAMCAADRMATTPTGGAPTRAATCLPVCSLPTRASATADLGCIVAIRRPPPAGRTGVLANPWTLRQAFWTLNQAAVPALP